ncbi:MAG: hypothetical protein PVI30_19915 [Myxococcales bacterium]|jgi:hypothetical protein
MGDKSPKAKKRHQQQKGAEKAHQAAKAKVKQEGQSRVAAAPAKEKKGA